MVRHAHKELADSLLCCRVHERCARGRRRCKWTAESRCALAAGVMRHACRPHQQNVLFSRRRCCAQLRFQRFGRKKQPFYRLVAIDSRDRRDGRPLEVLWPSCALCPGGEKRCRQGAQCSSSGVSHALALARVWPAMPYKCLHRSCPCCGWFAARLRGSCSCVSLLFCPILHTVYVYD